MRPPRTSGMPRPRPLLLCARPPCPRGCGIRPGGAGERVGEGVRGWGVSTHLVRVVSVALYTTKTGPHACELKGIRERLVHVSNGTVASHKEEWTTPHQSSCPRAHLSARPLAPARVRVRARASWSRCWAAAVVGEGARSGGWGS